MNKFKKKNHNLTSILIKVSDIRILPSHDNNKSTPA